MANKSTGTTQHSLPALETTKLRIAGVVTESIVDGPGLRYVIFTQGCKLNCPGCHNPTTHNLAGGYLVSLAQLLDSIIATKLIAGVTLSGGEPFLQASACVQLVKAIRQAKSQLNIVVYSGYYHQQLLQLAQQDPSITQLLAVTDILIDGPYEKNHSSLATPHRGSTNQRILILNKDLNYLCP